MWKINVFAAFLLAPFLGVVLFLLNLQAHADSLVLPFEQLNPAVESVEAEMLDLQDSVGFIRQTIEEQKRQYEEQKRILEELARESKAQKDLSDQVYEQRILERLGPPIATHRSDRVEIKVFSLKEMDYRGYIAKVKLFDPNAVKVVLAKDKWGESETTSQAVSRTGALLGVNGGGFYPVYQDGREYILPIGNTMVNGKLLNGFSPSHNDLFFAGLTRQGDLVGGIFHKKEKLMKLNPWQGVSFVPVLIRDRRPVDIPQKWQFEKQPRTIIGEYGNGDLILIVVDGRQSSWSSGVTLERLQIKLIELGVIDAYNLDGGGSSAFVYNGQVLNRPSDGRQRPVATNIVVMP
jgi:exopolysaccharide biosynthesis protein